MQLLFYLFWCYSQFFKTKLLTFGILFSITVGAVIVAKLVTPSISHLTLLFLALKAVSVAK